MGNLGDLIPSRDDHVLRQTRDLERQAQEDRAARRVARSDATPTFATVEGSFSGFDLTSTVATVLSRSFTVPRGKTDALVLLGAVGGCRCELATGYALLRLQTRIAGSPFGPVITAIEAGRYGSTSLTQALTLTGLSEGDEITIAVEMSFGVLATDSSNSFVRLGASVSHAQESASG